MGKVAKRRSAKKAGEGVWVVLLGEGDPTDVVLGYPVDHDIMPSGGIIVKKALRRRVRKRTPVHPGQWVPMTLRETAEYLASKRHGARAIRVPSEDAIPRRSAVESLEVGEQAEPVEAPPVEQGEATPRRKSPRLATAASLAPPRESPPAVSPDMVTGSLDDLTPEDIGEPEPEPAEREAGGDEPE